MMKCPCLNCKYRKMDKNCDQCRFCQARIAYADSIDPERMRPPVLMDSPSIKESKSNKSREEKPNVKEQQVSPEDAKKAIETICEGYRVDIKTLMAGSGNRKAMLLPGVAQARKAASKALFGLGMKRKLIAEYLNISVPSVAKHLKADDEAPPPPPKDPQQIVTEVCEKNGVTPEIAFNPNGLVDARTVIIASLRKEYKMPLETINRITNLSTATISKYVRIAKDQGIL